VSSLAYVNITTAPPGAGKTYSRCARFLLDEWLAEPGGFHISNFPIRFDDWEDEDGKTRKGLYSMAADRHGLSKEAVDARVRVIPAAEIARWKTGDSGPWEFFPELHQLLRKEARDRAHDEALDADPQISDADLLAITDAAESEVANPLDRAHVAIDEAAKIWPSSAKTAAEKRLRQKLNDWLSTIRHEGCAIEFVCQHIKQLPQIIRNLAGRRTVLTSTSLDREPILGIEQGDWLQLYAKVTGDHQRWFREEVKVPDGETEKTVSEHVHLIDPAYFTVYDSFNRADGTSGERKREPFESRSLPRLVLWFVGRNWWRLGKRVLQVGLLVWLILFGGAGFLFRSFQNRLTARLDIKEQAVAKPSTVSPRSGPVTPAENKEFETSYLRQRVTDLELERDALIARLGERHSLSLIDDRGVGFTSGDYYAIGETILWGPYRGAKLDRIDRSRRAAWLDDGTVLRLGVEPEHFDDTGWVHKPEADGPAHTAGFPAGLPSSAGQGGGVGPFSPNPTPAEPIELERTGHAPGRVRSVLVR